MGKACTNYDSSCFSAAPIMSELVCVTSGCREGGVGIETRGAQNGASRAPLPRNAVVAVGERVSISLVFRIHECKDLDTLPTLYL